jgi:hypothetical protein
VWEAFMIVAARWVCVVALDSETRSSERVFRV